MDLDQLAGFIHSAHVSLFPFAGMAFDGVFGNDFISGGVLGMDFMMSSLLLFWIRARDAICLTCRTACFASPFCRLLVVLARHVPVGQQETSISSGLLPDGVYLVARERVVQLAKELVRLTCILCTGRSGRSVASYMSWPHELTASASQVSDAVCSALLDSAFEVHMRRDEPVAVLTSASPGDQAFTERPSLRESTSSVPESFRKPTTSR